MRLWDPATGQHRSATPHRATPAGCTAVAFSPDGELLARAGGDEHGAAVGPGHRPAASANPSPATPATVYGGGVQPGRAAAGQRPATTARCGCGTRPPASHVGEPLDRPRRHGVPGWRSAPTASCWPRAGARRHGAAVGPGHRPAASASPSTGHTDAGVGVAFSPDGELLATRRRRRHGAAVGPGHRRAGRRAAPPATPAGCAAVAFSPDGSCWPAAGDDGTVRLWDPATGEPGRRNPSPGHTGRVIGVAFSPDGELLATRRRRRHGAAVGPGHRPARRRTPHRPHRRGDRGGVQPGRQTAGHRRRRRHGAAVGPGHRPASRPTAHRPHRRGATGWRSAPTASCWPRAGGDDGTVRLWDPATGQPVGEPLTGHTGRAVRGGVQPGRRSCWPSAGDDGTVRLWDPATGQPVGEPAHRPHRRGDGGGVQPGRAPAGHAPATTARCGCGTRPPASPVGEPLTGHTGAVMRGGVQPGRSAAGHAPAATARCGCGTRPPASRSAQPLTGHTGGGDGRGVQPGRSPAGHGR